ncbi:MAG: hypothetical protein ABIS18_04275, partial [Actinomycetota bacterium]
MSDLAVLIERYLKEHDFDWELDSENTWYVRMDGENKKGISVIFKIGTRNLHVESYFIRAPELEQSAPAYRWILQRN